MRRIMAIGICCIAVVSVYLGAMMNTIEEEYGILPIGQVEERVATDTVFEQTIRYLDCNEEETIRAKASDKVVGMTRDEVADLYREWQIESFGRDKVVLRLAVQGVCKEHRKQQFLGVRDDMVAIYYGTPSEKPILKAVTTIKVDTLVEPVREELARGISFRSEEERLRIMEGLEAR